MDTPLRISILSDAGSWKNAFLASWIEALRASGHRVHWVHTADELPEGELLFMLGFGRILTPSALRRHRHNLVVHESRLPRGRGWSPLSWQVIEGAGEIPLTLFEAVEKVDAGKIYLQSAVPLAGTELIGELRRLTITEMLRLCAEFVGQYPSILERGVEQSGPPSYYPKRAARDSRLDPDKTLREQFNLLRTVDNDHYPAFFSLHGKTYVLRIEKNEDDPAERRGNI